MAQILPIRRYKAFDPDATWTMGAAYEKAINTVHPDAEPQFVIRELIAKRIIQMAQIAINCAHQRLRRAFCLAFSNDTPTLTDGASSGSLAIFTAIRRTFEQPFAPHRV